LKEEMDGAHRIWGIQEIHKSSWERIIQETDVKEKKKKSKFIPVLN
jgi:hypothetical protein